MLCLLQQAKQIYQLHYTAIQQSRERWDSHFKTEVCFNYTYIFSKGRNKTESRRLDRRDWPCFSDPLLYEEERKETTTTLKSKAAKEIETALQQSLRQLLKESVWKWKWKWNISLFHQFFDFLTLSKASRSLHRNLHCIFIQLYLYSVLSSLLSRSRKLLPTHTLSLTDSEKQEE